MKERRAFAASALVATLIAAGCYSPIRANANTTQSDISQQQSGQSAVPIASDILNTGSVLTGRQKRTMLAHAAKKDPKDVTVSLSAAITPNHMHKGDSVVTYAYDPASVGFGPNSSILFNPGKSAQMEFQVLNA